MDIDEMVQSNMASLQRNVYPGRGIIIGESPDARHLIQVYWIMGRSENSRNRIFKKEASGFVKTEVFDKSRATDPSLTIYYPIKHHKNCHIVTNGSQTDTILSGLRQGEAFEQCLKETSYEPDDPHFTPRISGLVNLDDDLYDYQLSIIKRIRGHGESCVRSFHNYTKGMAGKGHLITTYAGDGNPLPSFEGEPLVVKLLNEIESVAEHYWKTLNEENRISLLVKFIEVESKGATIKIINKNKE